MIFRLAAVAVLLLSLSPRSPAHAQAPSAEARAEARTHFERAVRLFDGGQYEAALIEFEAAHAAAPNYRVLYNIGNVHAALHGHAVQAVEAYERYLWEGGEDIAADRRQQVEEALAAQRQLIGSVTVTSNVEGATVTVDGVDTAHTLPLESPIRLAIGRYAVGLRLAGWEGPTRQVTVAGQSEQTIEIPMTQLVEARGTLAIESPLDAVEVLVDGARVGITSARPRSQTYGLAEEIPITPGEHEVVGRRVGYLDVSRRVTVANGARVSVELGLARDPDAAAEHLGTLALTLPDAPAQLRVDGERVALSEGRAALPVGSHRIVVEVEDRQPFEQQVELASTDTLSLTPALAWEPTERLNRLRDNNTRRWVGLATGIGGLAGVGAGIGILAWALAVDGDRAALEPDYIRCTMTSMECTAEAAMNAQEYLNQQSWADLLRIVSLAVGGLGVAATVIGALLFFNTSSEEEIDAAAHAEGVRVRVVPGLGDVSVVGTF